MKRGKSACAEQDKTAEENNRENAAAGPHWQQPMLNLKFKVFCRPKRDTK